MELSLILVTAPNIEIAKNISEKLVKQKVCACVNILNSCLSIYEWENKLCETQEVFMIIKTLKNKFSAVREIILTLHPYEVVEIIEVETTRVDNKYLDWVMSSIEK